MDIGSGGGSQVLAAADGVVLEAGAKGTYGNLIIIQHPNGQVTGVDSTRYAHLETINVKVGDAVKVGQPIGIEGNTGGGLSTGVHLHFEVRDANGQSQNPYSYFDPATTKVAEDPKGILKGGH
jgi:murein DD-endopeptidase MepM/ murein hydrolase activator NlpD